MRNINYLERLLMLVKVKSFAIIGIDVIDVTVEVNIASRGFPGFDIVGLPNKSIAESKERIKTALINSGFEFPEKRITVNLAPADIQKEGTLYDFPIAVGIICAVFKKQVPSDSLFFGELSLDGEIKLNKAAFIACLHSSRNNLRNLYFNKKNFNEISLIKGLNLYETNYLKEFIDYIKYSKELNIFNTKGFKINKKSMNNNDFKYIAGQSNAKRALEISACGGHNVMLFGYPGVGKTSLANAFSSILPDLTEQEILEVTKIYSSVGLLKDNNGIITSRQVRAPHHTISYSGLLGGGKVAKVGELSLAHKGVLFLDEFSEFPRNIIESLRQPIESKVITISRSNYTVKFPCDFTLLTATNPCPCGYNGHSIKKCNCSDYAISKFKSKISGPILDRIDLFVSMHSVSYEDLSNNKYLNKNESSSQIKTRVVKARKIMLARNNNILNSNLSKEQLKEYCILDSKSIDLLNTASKKFYLSTRSYIKVIKVSRTIADLSGEENIKYDHILEALQFINKL